MLKNKKFMIKNGFSREEPFYRESHLREAILDFQNCIKIMNKINRIGIIKNVDNDDYKIKQFYECKYNIEIFEIDELLLKIFGEFK